MAHALIQTTAQKATCLNGGAGGRHGTRGRYHRSARRSARRRRRIRKRNVKKKKKEKEKNGEVRDGTWNDFKRWVNENRINVGVGLTTAGLAAVYGLYCKLHSSSSGARGSIQRDNQSALKKNGRVQTCRKVDEADEAYGEEKEEVNPNDPRFDSAGRAVVVVPHSHQQVGDSLSQVVQFGKVSTEDNPNPKTRRQPARYPTAGEKRNNVHLRTLKKHNRQRKRPLGQRPPEKIIHSRSQALDW
jgi:hypothetical protein